VLACQNQAAACFDKAAEAVCYSGEAEQMRRQDTKKLGKKRVFPAVLPCAVERLWLKIPQEDAPFSLAIIPPVPARWGRAKDLQIPLIPDQETGCVVG
jgi:hypothetical protein